MMMTMMKGVMRVGRFWYAGLCFLVVQRIESSSGSSSSSVVAVVVVGEGFGNACGQYR
jgi:hypothetical protein